MHISGRDDGDFTNAQLAAALAPAGVIALTILYDVVSVIHWPKWIASSFALLTAPFQNFLKIEDLEEASPDKLKQKAAAPQRKLRALIGLSSLQSLLSVGWTLSPVSQTQRIHYLANIAFVVAWAYAGFRVWMKRPSTPPYSLFAFYIGCFLLSGTSLFLAAIQANARITQLIADVLQVLISAACAYVIGSFSIKDTPPGPEVATGKEVPSSTMTMPEDSVSLWQWMTFSFVGNIFPVAMSRRLEIVDVWSLSPYFKHRNLFNKYLEYKDRYPSHSLIRFLLSSNSFDLIIDVTLAMWKVIGGFICTYALQQILAALERKPTDLSKAYLFAFITFATHLSFAQVDLIKSWHSRRSYERARGQLFCALHFKALHRRDAGSSSAPMANGEETAVSGADLGKIVNLMQGDAYILAQRFWQSSSVFASTVRLILSLVYLHSVMGWSFLAGVVAVLAAYVLNYPLGRYQVYITRQSWKARDQRMSSVNELFQNIRFLKFYGWETLWCRRALDKRNEELKWRVKENVVSILISFIWIWVPSAMALFSFLVYTLVAGERLTVSTTFTALSLLSQLRGPMMQLPSEIFAYLHAYVSYQRIVAYLKEEEVPDWASTLSTPSKPAETRLKDIAFQYATFEWTARSNENEAPRFVLGPLNVNFPRGALTLVTGSTGSGKSALLGSLLGELYCVEGSVSIDKSGHQVALCAQNPWLEHATIRENIIFGSQRGFDEQRYNAVIEACALPRDLEMFDAGDRTEIGERGVTLSGGQKARVALARALYSEAKLILLDDPLAAVDMHTAQHIVEHCLSGPLAKDRTIILVTHHITMCLSSASYIVELKAGKVILQGSVKELQASGELKTVIAAEDDTGTGEAEGAEVAEVHENEADDKGSEEPDAKRDKKSDGKLVEAEHREEGRVSVKTYITYIRSAGISAWILIVFMTVSIRLINLANDLFLAQWSEAYEQGSDREEQLTIQRALLWASTSLNRRPWPLDGLPAPDDDTKPWLMIYLFISLAGAAATLIFLALGFYSSLQASRKLFREMLLRLIRAPSRFFDTTPLGRILNRCTSDFNVVDGNLQSSATAALLGVLNFVTSFLFIVVVIPQFVPFAIIIAWLYIRLAPPYVKTARDLRRLESVSISPAFAGFDELLRGITHVRAFGMEQRYQDGFYKKVDLFQGFDHVYWLVAGWLRWRYDCLGSVVVFVTTAFALWTGASDGFTALVIVQAGVFAEASRQLVSVAAQLELDFNSAERVGEYLGVPQEAPAIIDEKRPPAYWPSNTGQLEVEDLLVKYAPDLPPVLSRISFTVKPGEKVGVVGRTGSGKSTLALSLLRVIEASEGKIILDGIDISTIGLEDLRSRVTIVSQDVSLFTGTVRSNLDPFGEHTDSECLDVLERCHLISREDDSKSGFSLDSSVSPSGSFSAGERQLVALARAILRGSQVIIMDEATSQIDIKLDDQIQRTIREELAGAMVITIAHRLKTIIDYDRILVLGEGGHILEFDTPANLFKKSNSTFREMCRRSADWSELKEIVDHNSRA